MDSVTEQVQHTRSVPRIAWFSQRSSALEVEDNFCIGSKDRCVGFCLFRDSFSLLSRQSPNAGFGYFASTVLFRNIR